MLICPLFFYKGVRARDVKRAMSDEAGSVTLIFYRIQNWLSEPTLNVVSAVLTASPYSHVEMSIGATMENVVRIYNDSTGVEITPRTGRNPGLEYVSLGCSKRAETAMLAFAQGLKGRPFSNVGMARSIVWPRQTDCKSFYCAELVAAVLQRGGLMSSSSNPGAATPASLHALYKKSAAATGNPWKMARIGAVPRCVTQENQGLLGFANLLDDQAAPRQKQRAPLRRRGDSPPRASFRVIQ